MVPAFRLERAGSPKFLGDLRKHAPGYDPDGVFEAGLRGFAPTSCLVDVAFRSLQSVGLRHFPISGFNSAACLLAVYAS